MLAGGTGSRLWPMTRSVSKQLLPVYDKPMIFYPISTLMLAGIREILIITTPHEQPLFMHLLGDGSDFGVSFQYETQPEPKGLAQALIIGEEFLSGDSCLMILGDNIFHGSGLGENISSLLPSSGAHVFTYEVKDSSQYGVLFTDQFGNPTGIEEKPQKSNSRLAVTGLYFFDKCASAFAKEISPSPRGELEITSVINRYLQNGQLTYSHLNRGTVWLDTGNPLALNDASEYVRVLEERTGLKISCLEEIAWRKRWISDSELEFIAGKYGKTNHYGKYLMEIAESKSNFTNTISHKVLSRLSEKSVLHHDLVSFSVIVPIYQPKFEDLRACINSIKNQSLQPLETIFVFDGHKNQLLEDLIYQTLPNSSIHILPSNVGQGSARNFGAAKALGSFLAFIDQDDLWGTNHLKEFADVLSGTNFAFGYSDICKIDEDGNILLESMMSEAVNLADNRLIKWDITDYLFRDLMIFPTSAVVNRLAFRSVGGFAENLRGHEDDELFRKLVQRYEAHFHIKSISASWRSHALGTSSSSKMSDSRLEYGRRLLSVYNQDSLARQGIASRLITSHLRELNMTIKLKDRNFQTLSIRNLSKLVRICIMTQTRIPKKILVLYLVPTIRLKIFSIKFYRLLRL